MQWIPITILVFLMSIPIAAAEITVNPTSLDFGITAVGDQSAEQSYLLTGEKINKGQGVVVTPPGGFLIGVESGGPYQATPLVLYGDKNKEVNTNIYVVFAPAIYEDYTDIISHVAPSVTLDMPVSGTVVPHPPPIIIATATGESHIDLDWMLNANNEPVLVARNENDTFGSPAKGETYAVHDTLSGGGLVIYTGNGVFTVDNGLWPNTDYYYQNWSIGGNGAPGGPYYSEPIATSAATLPEPGTGLAGIVLLAMAWGRLKSGGGAWG